MRVLLGLSMLLWVAQAIADEDPKPLTNNPLALAKQRAAFALGVATICGRSRHDETLVSSVMPSAIAGLVAAGMPTREAESLVAQERDALSSRQFKEEDARTACALWDLKSGAAR